jgi:hypothetical protein
MRPYTSLASSEVTERGAGAMAFILSPMHQKFIVTLYPHPFEA